MPSRVSTNPSSRIWDLAGLNVMRIVMPTLAITEQISRFGSPEQQTMALLDEIPAGRRQYWRATAAAAPLARTAGAARRLGCL